MKYHYVYRITNLITRKHYYGCRTSSNHPSDDLGSNYFSSSSNKDFIEEQKLHPTRFRYKIIQLCSSRDVSLQLEIKLHTKFNVASNASFINRANQTNTGFDRTGVPISEEQKEIIRKAQRGRTSTKKQKQSAKKMMIQLKKLSVCCMSCGHEFDLGNFCHHINGSPNKGNRLTADQKNNISEFRKNLYEKEGTNMGLYIVVVDGIRYLCYDLWQFFSDNGVSPPTGRKKFLSKRIGTHRNRKIINTKIDTTDFQFID